MLFGYREVCLEHETPDRHPETAARLRAIRETLAECHGVEYRSPPDVDPDLLRRVHDADYVDGVREFCAAGGGSWDADTVGVEATWDAALASAGLGVWAAEHALEVDPGSETPFAIGRPPGHHAVVDDAMGFCFFNNVVLGAQAALDAGADRVAIVDWDVHHGNGGQDICYDRGDVFNVSLHQDGLFPGTGEVAETGTGDGAMRNCNVPFPKGTDTVAYLAAFEEVILPSLRDYDPDLVLVSAGFDAHEYDPISQVNVSTDGFALMAAELRDLAVDVDAGLGFVLEGGYDLKTLSDSVETVHETLEGYVPEEPTGEVGPAPRSVIDSLREVGFGE